MKIVLHIGTHKTGSTALQQFLYHNRDALLADGYLYPQTGLEGVAHHDLAWKLRRAGKEQAEQLLGELEKEAQQAGVENLILSSEEFEFNRDLRALDVFTRHELKIVLYLRRPDGYLESEYNQHVKMPSMRFSEDIYHFYFRHDFAPRFNYRYLTNLWASVAGPESLCLVNYEQCRAERTRVFRACIDCLGIAWRDDFVLPDEQVSNNRIANQATLYLARLNRLESTGQQHYRALAAVSTAFAGQDEFGLLTRQARNILWERFGAANAAVARQFGMEPFVHPDEDPGCQLPVLDFYADFDPARYAELLAVIRRPAEPEQSGEHDATTGMYVIGFPGSDRMRLFHERNNGMATCRCISAVDGATLPFSLVENSFRADFIRHQLQARNASWLQGTLGCLLSHLHAIEQAITDGVDFALFVEDDAWLRAPPHEYIRLARQGVYDLVYLNDRMQPGQRRSGQAAEIVTLNAGQLSGTGTEGYLLSRHAMEVLTGLYRELSVEGMPSGYDGMLQSLVLHPGEMMSKPGGKSVMQWARRRSANIRAGIAVPSIIAHADNGQSLIAGIR